MQLTRAVPLSVLKQEPTRAQWTPKDMGGSTQKGPSSDTAVLSAELKEPSLLVGSSWTGKPMESEEVSALTMMWEDGI